VDSRFNPHCFLRRAESASMERLVSLAPSMTSTVQALGAGDQLVGVTSHDAFDEPSVIGGWLTPDLDRLDELEPDLVLTADPLQRDLRDRVADRGYRTFHREPATLDAVIDGFEAIGEAIDRPRAGLFFGTTSRQRVATVRALTPDGLADRPVVYCEEWPDPPMAAGNWVPEAVRAAGGRYPFADAGTRSAAIDRETVVDAEPDHIVIHHCGRGEQATADVRERWDLEAELHVIDDALLNQPGPRLIDGIEQLAERFHGVSPPPARSSAYCC